MTRVFVRAAVLLVLAFPATATAQTLTPIRPVTAGDKLRITMSDGRTVSAIAAAMNETTLQVRDGSTTRAMDLKSVSRVERLIPDPIRNGVGWGLLAGFGAGAALGALAGGGCESFCIVGRGETALVVGLLGAGAGTAVGAIADARTHRAEVIYPVPVTRRPITVTPTSITWRLKW